MVLSDIWNIIIFPTLTKWAVDILPLLTNIATQVLSVGNDIFNYVKTVFDTIWQDAIAPAMQIIQDIWSDCWDSIIDFWNTWGVPIFDQMKTAIGNLTSFFLNIWNTILKPVLTTLGNTFTELWTLHLKPLLDNFLNFVGTLIEGALRIYNEFIVPIINLFVDMFGPIIAGILNYSTESFFTFLGVVIDVASGILEALGGVMEFIVGVFTRDWETAWNGVKQIFTGIWNGIVSALETALNFIIDGINWVINGLNQLKFSFPSWVPFAGGKSFGLNIPLVDSIELPRLAQGAVIPPNREFLAVLGDQKQGTNIEAPLSTIEQAVENVMNRRGYGGEQIIENVLMLDGEVIYRNQKKVSRRHGISLVEGGNW